MHIFLQYLLIYFLNFNYKTAEMEERRRREKEEYKRREEEERIKKKRQRGNIGNKKGKTENYKYVLCCIIVD